MSQDFINFARAHEVEIHDLYPSDKIRRCGTIKHPGQKNGAYLWDGERGFVWNWEQGNNEPHWFNDPKAKPWTKAEQDEWKAKRRASQLAREADYAQAARGAQKMLNEAVPQPHNYLHAKGFPAEKMPVSATGVLLIPMRSFHTGAIQGLQQIRWVPEDRAHEKKMLHKMQAKDAVYWLGNSRAPEVFLVEGFATGLSVSAALRSMGLNASVLVTFSAHNMLGVSAHMRGRKCFIFADNDESKTGETIAIKSGLPYCMNPELGDANDLHKKSGVMAVAAQIMQVRRTGGKLG